MTQLERTRASVVMNINESHHQKRTICGMRVSPNRRNPQGSSRGCGLEVEPARACCPYAAPRPQYLPGQGALRHAYFDILTVVSPN